MKIIKNWKVIFVITGLLIQTILTIPKASAGSFGAQIFCTMREGGNDHESSWEAAYSYIKKQKGGIFKTSPQQAASQIIETVVRDKDEFSFCVEYLNKLYPDRELQRKQKKEEEAKRKEERKKINRRKKIETLIDEEEEENYSEDSFNRYSY